MNEYETYKKIEDLPVVTKVVLPDASAVRRGVIQFIHGMCEVKERYIETLEYFASQGFVCVISDLRGHGENVEFDKDLGYFGDDGVGLLVEDVHSVNIFIKNNYPDLPITLIGFSMGSMIARAFAKKYDEDIDMLILLGSPSHRGFSTIGSWVIEFITLFVDEHEINRFIAKFCMGPYIKRYAHEGVANSWICSDMSVVEKFNSTQKCGFIFTLNGFHTLCMLQRTVYSKRNWKLKNKKMPVAFFAGVDDPCILSKEKIEKSAELMRRVGYHNVSCKLYNGMRHDILHEPDYTKVYEDILKILPVA